MAATGVPAIMIHQLYLLPGTEFFDRRAELGLEMLADCAAATPEVVAPQRERRSDFARYVVARHPHMTSADQARGARLIGINHVLHNHDLGRLVVFYLTRHGLRPRDAYDFLDQVLLGEVPELDDAGDPLLGELRACILGFAGDPGRDPYVFHARLSNLLWFTCDAGGRRRSRADAVRALLERFFAALCTAHAVLLDPDEQLLLDELISYAVLVSPKPAWRPEPRYAFSWDVDRIWSDMQTTIHDAATRAAQDWDELTQLVARLPAGAPHDRLPRTAKNVTLVSLRQSLAHPAHARDGGLAAEQSQQALHRRADLAVAHPRAPVAGERTPLRGDEILQLDHPERRRQLLSRHDDGELPIQRGGELGQRERIERRQLVEPFVARNRRGGNAEHRVEDRANAAPGLIVHRLPLPRGGAPRCGAARTSSRVTLR